MERILLLSIDPDANRFRFFRLEVRPRPDGCAELVRRWGRLGSEGRAEIEPYPNLDEARAAHAVLLRRRLRRGYIEASEIDARAAHRLLRWHRAARRAPRQRAFGYAEGF